MITRTCLPLSRYIKHLRHSSSSPLPNLHPTAHIHPTATVSHTSTVGPFTYIGPNVIVGEKTTIESHCTLLHCDVGHRVHLHSGVRIGQDGFGFFPTSTPNTTQIPEKKPQELRVVIQDDVELGANTTVDRGSWRDTVIGNGTKIDNLVHLGHNVVVGSACLIAAQTGIAGSTTLGSNVLVGGQVGIAQHLNIGDKVRIAAKSGVISDVKEGETVGGYPAVAIGIFRREAVLKRREGKTKRSDE